MKLKLIKVFTPIILLIIVIVSFAVIVKNEIDSRFAPKSESEIAKIISLNKMWYETYFKTYDDYTSLITSRTQLRRSLNLLQTEGKKEHLDKVVKITNDAIRALPQIEGIRLYNDKKILLVKVGPMKDVQLRNFDKQTRFLKGAGDNIIGFSRSPLNLDGKIIGYIDVSYRNTKLKAYHDEISKNDYVFKTEILFANNFDDRLLLLTSNPDPLPESLKVTVKEIILSNNLIIKVFVNNDRSGLNLKITNLFNYLVLPVIILFGIIIIYLWSILHRGKDEMELLVKESAKANNELSQIVYRTSHDLRAPITSIRGLTYILEDELESGNYNDVLDGILDIQSSADSLARLIDDLMITIKSDLSSEKTDLVAVQEIFDDLNKLIKNSINLSNIQLITNIGISDIFTKKRKLTQILYNIVMNSIKFSDPSKISSFISISINEVEDEIYIKVEDNGIGMTEENVSKIFDMFSRFSAKSASGSGLGMYIVHKDVASLKGRIFVTSELNLKTIITIVLPRKE